MERWLQTSAVLAVLLFGLAPARAQLTAGDNLNMTLGGDLGAGYSGGYQDGAFTEVGPSNHNVYFGGDGQFRGYYYNPSFLSFHVQPFYNRNQSNSAYQSITDSSGVQATANFFTGSHFPGSVSFDKTYDGTGQFGVPGVAGLTTNGSNQTITIDWSALIPDLPSLHATYMISGQDSAILGTESNSHYGGRSLTLTSDYTLKGFALRGSFGHLSTDTQFPGFLAAGDQRGMNSDTNLYTFQATHSLPMRGYWTATASRTTYSSQYTGGQILGTSSGSTDALGTSVTVNPLSRLTVGFNALYQTNLLGALQQQLLQAGSPVPVLGSQFQSSAVTVGTSAFYSLCKYVTLNGQWSHQQQDFLGQSVSVDQYGGGANLNFAQRFLGSFTFSVGANDTATQQGNSGAGLYANVNFARRIKRWEISSNFSYAQAVQTLLATYATSMYAYGTNVRRKFGDDLYWGATFNGTHSGLVQIAGTTNRSESYSTNLTFRRYALSGTYAQSDGISILTPQGLVAVPTGIPAPLLGSTLLFNARSYGGGFSTVLKRWEMSVNYARAISATNSSSLLLNNGSTLFNARVRYRLRKLYFDSGYTRFVQVIGAAGLPPATINTYYLGFSRWFDIF